MSSVKLSSRRPKPKLKTLNSIQIEYFVHWFETDLSFVSERELWVGTEKDPMVVREEGGVHYGVPFPPKFNVPFYIVLYTIYPTFCVCHLSLHSRFNFLHSTSNFDSCNIQVFAFDSQLFISNSQVFEFDLQVQWNVHSFFCIQHLAFDL